MEGIGKGAEGLEKIYGTEKDRVNCPFYHKVGACRHGDKCARRHNKPIDSPTLLLINLYRRPTGQDVTEEAVQNHFDDFYEDIHQELSKYGEIDRDSIRVCDNVIDHLVGNVYVIFHSEQEAKAAMSGLQGRFYGGFPIIPELSPVTDFREATCRKFEENHCTKGGYCNFIHPKVISRSLKRRLYRSRSPRGYDRCKRSERDEYNPYSRYRRDKRDRRQYEGSPRYHRRESSVERRAKIEKWNKEREEAEAQAAAIEEEAQAPEF